MAQTIIRSQQQNSTSLDSGASMSYKLTRGLEHADLKQLKQHTAASVSKAFVCWHNYNKTPVLRESTPEPLYELPQGGRASPRH